jgi:hypothetical protein
MKKTKTSVLYLGDDSLDSATSYLAGVMKHFNIGFDYVAFFNNLIRWSGRL